MNNSVEGLTSRVTITENRTSELKDEAEILQTTKEVGKKISKQTKRRWRISPKQTTELWGKFKKIA